MRYQFTFFFFLAIVIAVGIYLFRIVQPFLLPLLMAGTLALLIHPLFQKLLPLFRGYRRIAAAVVSLLVVLLIALPLFTALGLATQELIKYGDQVVEEVQETTDEQLSAAVAKLRRKLSGEDFAQIRRDALDGNGIDAASFRHEDKSVMESLRTLSEAGAKEVADAFRQTTDLTLAGIESMPGFRKLQDWLFPMVTEEELSELRSSGVSMIRALLGDIYDKTTGLISNLVSFVVAFAVMILSFYYFLAEGPTISRKLEDLLPLERTDEMAMVKKFETICRGVVLGTLVAAVTQGILVGVAFAILGIPGTWLLMCLTVVAAMIPFVGAGAVYVPVSVYLAWNGRYGAAIFLILYGTLLVSTIDNLIRAHMIHGASRLHPLVALISTLGALQLVGLWGIFVGPVVAGVFYALVTILQQKVRKLEDQDIVVSPS